MFIVNLTYILPLEKVEKHLTDHIAFLDQYYGRGNFICSGRKNPRTGGVILCNARNIEEVYEMIREDPFYKNKVANYDILEFQPTKYADAFKVFVE